MSKTKRFQSLKDWRDAHGYSQREAAQLLGVTQPGYWKYETGQRHPRPAILRRITKLTGVPVEVLAGAA